MPLKSSSEADLQKFLILPRRILKSPSSKLKKPNRQKQRCSAAQLRERGSSHWAEACCHADNQDISVETALLSSKLALWAVLMAQGRTETLRSPQRSHFIEVADPAPEEAAGQEARL
ncbi:Transmembrane protein [Trichinella pseudospiralis]